MKERLEDLLDVRAHAEACARNDAFYVEAGRTRRNIVRGRLVPDFPLRDEENIRVWAEVLAPITGIDPYELGCWYRTFLVRMDEEEERASASPEEAVIYLDCRLCGSREISMEETDPEKLAAVCAAMASGSHKEYMRDIWFRVYGRGVVVEGDATRWRRLCRCGRSPCPWHGLPTPNQPEWYDIYDPQLWPWVGVVPGSEWQQLPGARP